jgi:glycolate oxidase iron-sulfur subunit
MHHEMQLTQLGPRAQPMADAVQACVHCGFCLPACPTYQVLGQEMDSPRGRIYLMKEVLEGHLAPELAQVHIDRCLGCLACETACPSGVAYHQLLTPYRERVESQRRRGAMERLRRWLVMNTLPYPRRFTWAARLGRLARPLRGLTPASMRPMFDLLPERLSPAPALPEVTPAIGPRRGRVALLAGCVQRVLDGDINWATVRVLARNGIEVVVPRGQGCCGSLAWHLGEGDGARAFARTNLEVFPLDVDAIVTNAAGCGSGLRDYKLMFMGTPESDLATRFSGKVMDVSAFLDRVGFAPPPPLKRPLKIAYHDACHLAHAQQVRSAPRKLLAAIPNLTLLEIADGDTCCGSAGTYNLDEPAIAAELGKRKAGHVREIACDLVAAGNIGCMVQIRTHLASNGGAPTVLHTMQVLDRADRGEL